MSWNLADIWEVVAEAAPDRLAQACGDRSYTWAQFDQRSGALAADLLARGLTHQGKAAAYLYNGPEYLESYFAAFKVAGVPVNVNFRYGPTELIYLLDNADAEAVVFHARFTPTLEQIREKLDRVLVWYVVDDDSGEAAPDWAVPYESVMSAAGAGGTRPRSGDDLLLLYTGGTTGMPKGVMWRQDDLVNVLGGGGNPLVGLGPAAGLDEIRTRVASGEGARVAMPACPLMHGTGQFSAFIAMILGGTIVTLPDARFDPAVLWDAVERNGVNSISIVGDAFARPLLDALEAEPERWNLASVNIINSSGVMWSEEVKQGLLRHIPGAFLFDSLGSSEAVGMGASITGGGASAHTAAFSLGPGVRVITDDDKDVEAGSGDVGVIALPGFIPVGYYKDEEKTARTFRTIGGQRYTIPGDCATVDADGSIHLLGRGSAVINTGGEKVYPEEVEEVIKRMDGVVDAVCVGLPNERFGESVCALVQIARRRPSPRMWWPRRCGPNWPPTRCPAPCSSSTRSGAARPARSTTRACASGRWNWLPLSSGQRWLRRGSSRGHSGRGLSPLRRRQATPDRASRTTRLPR
ncbi:MAG TPA: AMP-binding protein [Acidimicrobiales bacterium]|nr:AMP-binding protein [Acidimicrobiales bacterium]